MDSRDKMGSDCSHDVMSSKPVVGRGIADVSQSVVTKCGSKRCMTCTHIMTGSTFVSNISGRKYDVSCRDSILNCSSKNVIYLISCRECGVQYIGKTSQMLRNRLNNHRNRIKQLYNLFLYNHFNSDGHKLEDIAIMPIEEVVLEHGDNISVASKLLLREEYWMKELGCIYPYGLNDNVKGFGNISKFIGSNSTVVYSFFNKHDRKPRNRSGRKSKYRMFNDTITERFTELLLAYKNKSFSTKIRTFVLGLPR